MKKVLLVFCLMFCFSIYNVNATEVDKGKIPVERLNLTYKILPWKAAVWDIAEVIPVLKKGAKDCLFIDTRPKNFLADGTVKGAICLEYGKAGEATNILTEASLKKAIADKGLNKDTAKLIFFCQGPKCHRSYNATYMSVTKWGYKPENIVWFRAGYPYLFKHIKDSAKLKRRAGKYITQEGINKLAD